MLCFLSKSVIFAIISKKQLERSDAIILIGLPGVGKSTLGRAVSMRMGMPFVDLDERIEELAEMSVTEIFDRYGEERFREYERQALKDCPSNAIVATGGGTPCYSDNMQWMMCNGRVVHLTSATDRIIDRILDAAGSRPIFNGLDREDVRHKLEALWQKRKPFYTLTPYSFDTTYLDTIPELEAAVQSFITKFLNA